MKNKIFISCARKDYGLAIQVRDAIQRHTGVCPWVDLSGINTDAQFTDVLAKAIDGCELIVFVISRNSVESKWARKVVLYAHERGKKIYPIVIDDVQLPQELEPILINLDLIDIRDAAQRENFFSSLATEVSRTDVASFGRSRWRKLVATWIDGFKSLLFR